MAPDRSEEGQPEDVDQTAGSLESTAKLDRAAIQEMLKDHGVDLDAIEEVADDDAATDEGAATPDTSDHGADVADEDA